MKTCSGLAGMLFDFLLLMKDGGGETCELHVVWLWRCDFDSEVLERWAADVTMMFFLIYNCAWA